MALTPSSLNGVRAVENRFDSKQKVEARLLGQPFYKCLTLIRGEMISHLIVSLQKISNIHNQLCEKIFGTWTESFIDVQWIQDLPIAHGFDGFLIPATLKEKAFGLVFAEIIEFFLRI